MPKTICVGTGQRAVDPVDYKGEALALCPECHRVSKPIVSRYSGSYFIRSHSIRGENTRSHDKTMEALYVYAGGTLPNLEVPDAGSSPKYFGESA